jgi:hypothetical protein
MRGKTVNHTSIFWLPTGAKYKNVVIFFSQILAIENMVSFSNFQFLIFLFAENVSSEKKKLE